MRRPRPSYGGGLDRSGRVTGGPQHRSSSGPKKSPLGGGSNKEVPLSSSVLSCGSQDVWEKLIGNNEGIGGGGVGKRPFWRAHL